MKVNLKLIYHYIIIYLLIISQGSVLYNNNQEIFLAIYFILASLFALKKRRKKIDKELGFICILTIGLLVTRIATSGGLSFGSIGNIVATFLIAYLAVNYEKQLFAERYVKLVVFLSGISLAVFFIQIVDINFIKNYLPVSKQINGNCYGGYLATVVEKHALRNVGLATEPGRYQVYLIPALVFTLFKTECIHCSDKSIIWFRIILILTIISAQSTTGYIALLLVLAGYLLEGLYYKKSNQSKLRKKTNMILILACIALAIYLMFTGSENFIYENFINKMFNKSGMFDLSDNTGSVRIISLLTDLSIAIKHPLGMGFDAYQSLWLVSKVKFIGEPSSCVGLTISCAALGFPITLLIILFYIKELNKNWKNIIQKGLLLLLLFNTALAQPVLYYAPMLVMFMVNSNNRGEPLKYKNKYGLANK